MWPFDQNNQQMYEQYAQAHTTGNYGGIDPSQAIGQLMKFVQNAPPNEQQQVYQQHFSQMPQEQRGFVAQQMPPEYGVNPNNPSSLAQGFQQLGQQQPGLLQRVLSNPAMVSTAVSLATMAAKHVLNQQQQTR